MMAAQGDTFHIRVPKHPNKIMTQIILDHSLEPNILSDGVNSEIVNGLMNAICSGLPVGILTKLATQIAGVCVQKMPEVDKNKYIEHMIRTLEKMRGTANPDIPDLLKNADKVQTPISPDSIEAWQEVKESPKSTGTGEV